MRRCRRSRLPPGGHRGRHRLYGGARLREVADARAHHRAMGPSERGGGAGLTRTADTVLILGGGGMVGVQVAREVARELSPKRIVIAAVSEAEVKSALEFLRAQLGDDIDLAG